MTVTDGIQSRVPLSSVLNLNSFNLDRTLELLEQVMAMSVYAWEPLFLVGGDVGVWFTSLVNTQPARVVIIHIISLSTAAIVGYNLWTGAYSHETEDVTRVTA